MHESVEKNDKSNLVTPSPTPLGTLPKCHLFNKKTPRQCVRTAPYNSESHIVRLSCIDSYMYRKVVSVSFQGRETASWEERHPPRDPPVLDS